MLFDLILLAATAVGLQAGTPVLARTVERGETLAESDFTTAVLLPAQARGAILPHDAAGRQAMRRLAAGNPVRATDTAAPRLIQRGEAVSIVLSSGALRITANGRALGNAGQGEPVRVVNLDTSRTVDAVAEAPGQVRVMAQ